MAWPGPSAFVGCGEPAQVRWSKAIAAAASDATDTMSVAYGWTAELAAQIDLSERTIRRDLELHRGLKPDVIAGLRGQTANQQTCSIAYDY